MNRSLLSIFYPAVRLVNQIQTRRFEIRFAETEAELRQVWRLNYETYVKELAQEQAAGGDGLLPDPLRDHSKYIIALHQGSLVGMMAITFPAGPFSIESSLSDPSVLDGLRDKTTEYRRLAVSKKYRGKGIFLRMVDLAIQEMFPLGYHYAIISALEQQVPTYTRLGFWKIDRPFIKGACTYYPMMSSMEHFHSGGVETEKFPRARATLKQLDSAWHQA